MSGPFEPFRNLENMKQEIDRLLTSGFSGFTMFGLPRVDLYETDTEVVASCELPGLEKKEDISIDVEENLLTVSGTVNRAPEAQEERMLRKERFTGRFQREISIPIKVDAENIRASYKNGILEVRMPKLPNETRKRIEVDFGYKQERPPLGRPFFYDC